VDLQINAHMGWLDFLVIAAYLGFMLYVGWYVSRRMKSFDDFFIAGRTMTTPLLICTLVSTYYGIDVLFGTSELGFNEGIVAWFGYSRPTYLFFILAAFFLANRLRQHQHRSLPDVLAYYYGPKAGVTAAVASFIYSLPSLGLFGMGKVGQVIFGFDPWIGGLLFGGVALVYTLWGGLMADALTDTIQFVLMCVTLGIAIPIIMSHTGGFGTVAASLPASHFEPLGGIPVWLVVVYAATGLSILVEPAFYQRIFAARSSRDVRNALLIGVLLWSAYDWCVTAGGMLARAASQTGILPADTHPNEALLRIVIFALPAGLTGLFLAGVLAAEMSTIDSYCLVAGGNVVYDIYRPLCDPKAGDETLSRFTKWGILLSWGLGFVLAFLFERLLALWVFMSSILTSTVFVPVMAGLYYKGRKRPLAGLLSSAGGFLSVALFYLLVSQAGTHNEEYDTYILTLRLGSRSIEIWQEYALLVSLPISLLGFVAGSLLGRDAEPGSRPPRAAPA
jgi:SSS family solute:Na+ symporter